MKKEQYHKLRQKYFDGDTTSAEENLLKESGYLTADEDLYFEVLKTEKAESSKLDFKSFLEKAESEKIIPLVRKETNFKWIWLAASLVIFLSVGLFLMNQSTKHQTEKDAPPMASTEVYKKEKSEILDENVYQPEVDSTEIKNQNIASSDAVLDQILPKKSRMKRNVKVRFVDNSTSVKKPEKSEYESGYVIINGHKITSEKEAIEVTKYSFQVLANNVSQSLEQADATQTLNFDN